MSLVDYASSSDDENDAFPQQEEEDEIPQRQRSPSTTLPSTESNKQSPRGPPELPDASMLLNSPSIPTSSATDHNSLLVASRKRDSNTQPSSSLPRGKLPRGILPHSKNFPETAGASLVPPQLRGRSNIVTEDIGKLFVKKQPEPSSQ